MSYTLRFQEPSAESSKIIINYDGRDYESKDSYEIKKDNCLENIKKEYTLVVPFENQVNVLNPQTMNSMLFKQPKFTLAWENPDSMKLILKLDGDNTVYVSRFNYNHVIDTIKYITEGYKTLTKDGDKILLTWGNPLRKSEFIKEMPNFTLAWAGSSRTLLLNYNNKVYYTKTNRIGSSDVISKEYKTLITTSDGITLNNDKGNVMKFVEYDPTRITLSWENPNGITSNILLKYDNKDYRSAVRFDVAHYIISEIRKKYQILGEFDKNEVMLYDMQGIHAHYIEFTLIPLFTLTWEHPGDFASKMVLQLKDGRKYISVNSMIVYEDTLKTLMKYMLTRINEGVGLVGITLTHKFIPIMAPDVDINTTDIGKVLELASKFWYTNPIIIKLFNEILVKMGFSMNLVLEYFSKNTSPSNFEKIVGFVDDQALFTKYDLKSYGLIIFNKLVDNTYTIIDSEILAHIYAGLDDKDKKVARSKATEKMDYHIKSNNFKEQVGYKNIITLSAYCDFSGDAI
jgi:hypothetical protein